jgi:hypothetical protein
MTSLVRSSACAACIAAAVVVPSALAGQGVRVMPYGGMAPLIAIAAGGQVEAEVGRNLSAFADYSRWGWGLICVGSPIEGEQDDDRCGETGWTFHAGAVRHLRDAGANWRPYVSAAAGAAQVVEDGRNSGRVLPSLAGEAGYDWGGNRLVTVRLGLRWQGRPSVGTDFAGPVVGFRLRLR